MKVITRLAILLLCLPLLSCAHIQYVHERESLPRDSFVEITTRVVKRGCADSVCGTMRNAAVSSGAIIHTDPDGSYIIGSDHVCAIKKLESQKGVSVTFSAVGTSGSSHKGHILTTDAENDLCVMYVPGLKGTPIILRDHPPKHGEKVYNLASPRGVAAPPHNIPVFSGYYSGRDGRWDVYTIPAAGGSSGSPIVDVDGYMVGIIQAHLRGFNHLTISSNYLKIKKMITDVVSGRLSMRVYN